MRAHKNQDPISILLNAFGNSMTLFLSNLVVHVIDWTSIYRAYFVRLAKTGQRDGYWGHTGVTPPIEIIATTLRH
jgi:hypothetical protein